MLLRGQRSQVLDTQGCRTEPNGICRGSQSRQRASALPGCTVELAAALCRMWGQHCTRHVPKLCSLQQDVDVPRSCMAPAVQQQLTGCALGTAGVLGNPAAEPASLSCCQPKALPAALLQPPWSLQHPCSSLQKEGSWGDTAHSKAASLSLPHRWVPVGMESNVCSTITPYRQPLTVFAQPLWPLRSQALAPPGTRYGPVAGAHGTAGAHGAGSAHTGGRAASAKPERS